MFLIEILVVITLFAVFGLAVAKSHIVSSKTALRALHNSMAMQLAIDELESYASVDPTTISASDSYADTLARDDVTFSRTVTFTVNSDGSRTIRVRIDGGTSDTDGHALVSTKYSMWGSQSQAGCPKT